MKRNVVTRGLALVLSLTMCLSLLPFSALAGANEPMALYYDGHRTTYGGEWDYGSTDGYLEQDSGGKVKLSLSGGVPEGNTITAVYLVTADSAHSRKGTVYPVPAGAEGGLEGPNSIWVQNVVLSLDAGFYQTEFVTDNGSMYSVDFVDGEFSTPGVVQVVAPGGAPSTLQKPVVYTSGLKTTGVTRASYRGGNLAATAPNNGTLTYAKVSGPDWLKVDPTTGALTGVPTAAGAYSLCVTVTETAASGTITSDPAYITILIHDPKVTFTFNGSLNTNLSNTLTVKQGSEFIAKQWLSGNGSSPVNVPLPGTGRYTVTVEGTYWTSNGEQKHTYVDAQAFDANAQAVTLNVTPSNLRFVTPKAKLENQSDYYTSNCIFEWYKANNATPEDLIHTGSSLLCDGTIYVRAVPSGYGAVEYGPTGLIAVSPDNNAPELILPARAKYTVTATLKDSAGNPLSGQASIYVSDQFGNSRYYYGYGYAKQGGRITVADVPIGDGLTVTAVFSANGSRYESVTETLTAPTSGNSVSAGTDGVVTLAPRQGYITVPDSVAYSTTFQVKKSDGTVLPVSMSHDWYGRDHRLYFDDLTKVTGGETLTIDLNSSNYWKATASVTLDATKNGVLTDNLTRHYGSFLRITGSSPIARDVWYRIFDSEGKPVSWWNGNNYLGTSFSLRSDLLYAGKYTVLVIGRESYPAAAAAENLSKTKELLDAAGRSLYLEKTVTIADRPSGYTTQDVPMGVLPQTYPTATTIESSASGLTLDADAATISARVTVMPKDATQKRLEVKLVTNQASNSSDTVPDVINGSLYINGRRAETGARGSIEKVKVYPNVNDHQGNFSGLYEISIPDVGEYGGWPAVVQWQSYRANYEKVTAVAMAKVGNGNNGQADYVGEGAVNTPAVSVYAPETTSTGAFTVYGNAPRDSTVRITLDGAEVATANTYSSNQYIARVKLTGSYSWEEHQVGAVVTVGDNTYTATEKTVIFTPGLPSLSKIEITDQSGYYVTLWDNDNEIFRGYYYYAISGATRFRLTFRDGSGTPAASAVENVIVHVPRSDQDAELKATYNSTEKAWVTEAYYCGNNPPVGAWVEYTPKEPAKLFTDADFEKKKTEATDDQTDWATFISGKNDTSAPDNTINYKTVTDNLGDNITLTGSNDENTRQVTVKTDTETTYTITNKNETYNSSDIDSFKTLFSTAPPLSEDLMEQFDGDEYTKLSMENNVPKAVIINRYESSENALWTRTTITPGTYTEETWNTKDSSAVSITYSRNTAFTVTEGWDAPSKCYAVLIDWVNALEQIDAVFNDETPGSITTGQSTTNGGRMLTPPAPDASVSGAVSDAADPAGGWVTVAARRVLGSLPNGVHLSGNSTTAFYQMMVACIEQNIELDHNSLGERWTRLEAERSALGGGLYNNMLWKRGREFLKEVKKASDNAVAGGKFAGNAIEGGVASACKKYVEGKVKKAKNGGWPFGNSKAKEKDRKQMKEDWDRLDQKLTELESMGWKVDRSLMPPDPMPDEDKDDGSGSGTNPPAGSNTNGPGSSGTGNPTPPGGTPTTPGGTPTTPGTPSTPTGPGGPGTPPGQPPATPGTPPIQIPQLFPPKVTLPVPNTRKPVIDPSGIVYEGVKSNRVEDVTATIYEVDGTTGTRTVWNAGEYDQVNPYTTDENGFYQWMVPEGKWSVSFTKNGYEAYTTGVNDGSGTGKAGDTYYMPVAPAQLDVNINLQRSDPPEVESVKATPEGVYVVFSQYMDTTTLTTNRFSLLVNSVEVWPAITFVNAEEEGDGTYASEVLLEYPIGTGLSIALTVDQSVQSYTGKAMNANYVQGDVEVTQLTQLAAPSFTPAAGKVDVNTPVTIGAPSGEAWPSGTKVYYTTDGTAPTRASTLYTGSVLITGDVTIQAIAVCPGMADSAVTSGTFWTTGNAVIERITPAGSRVTVELSCANPGAVAWCAAYRQDGQMKAVRSETGPFASSQPVVFDLGTADYSFVKVFVLDEEGKPLCANGQAEK